jgi:hypothetical protein
LAGAISSGGTINFAERSLRGTGAGVPAVSGVACTTGLYTSMVDAGTSLAGYGAAGNIPTCSLTKTGLTSANVNIPAIN